MAYQKYDPNGDEIVLEGIFNAKKIWCYITVFVIFMIVMTLGLGLLAIPGLVIPMVIRIKNWKLYVTHTDIHYNAGCEQYILIPLSEISKISIIPGTTTILINNKHGSIFQTGNGVFATNQLRIKYVANYKEFVEAVRREMASRQVD